eukprot:g3884.t1
MEHWYETLEQCDDVAGTYAVDGSSIPPLQISEMRKVPRVPWGTAEALRLLQNGFPVILHGSGIADALLGWDVDYLAKHADKNSEWKVFESKSGVFQYCSLENNDAGYSYEPLMAEKRIRFADFVEQRSGRAAGAAAQTSIKRYLQQALNVGVGEKLTEDFQGVRWDVIAALRQHLNLGPLTSNLLLIGEPGNVTPCHYDEQHNFYAQLCGRKRWVLFSPDQFRSLYPFPVGHPADRQSQVDLYNPDYKTFPNFSSARGLDAELGPGDILHLPAYWFHHIENRTEETVGMTFWLKNGPTVVPPLPIREAKHPVTFLSMRRNVEKFAAQLVGPVRARAFFAAVDKDDSALSVQHRQLMEQLVDLVKAVVGDDVDDCRNVLRSTCSGRFEHLR